MASNDMQPDEVVRTFQRGPSDPVVFGDGPALGASFVGRNRNDFIGEWALESFIDVYEGGHAFGWATSNLEDPGARWRFQLEPDGEDTTLRFEVTIGPGMSGLTMAIASMPDREERIIHRRIDGLNACTPCLSIETGWTTSSRQNGSASTQPGYPSSGGMTL